MPARFLLRFDDLCPTMHWHNWSRIEKALDQHNIKPIIAVVPDNHDPQLVVDPPRVDFWERVRAWQASGWTIGLHGYQHRYETEEGGFLNINPRSEFAGLPVEAQRRKIRAGLEIFARHGVRPDLWVAPGHSFDATTVQVLIEHSVNLISDGFFWRPVRHRGMVWIPQQWWRFRPMPFGLWTVCLHSNTMSERGLRHFETVLARFASHITSVSEIIGKGPAPHANVGDVVFSKMFMFALQLKGYFPDEHRRLP